MILLAIMLGNAASSSWLAPQDSELLSRSASMGEMTVSRHGFGKDRRLVLSNSFQCPRLT